MSVSGLPFRSFNKKRVLRLRSHTCYYKNVDLKCEAKISCCQCTWCEKLKPKVVIVKENPKVVHIFHTF